MKPRDLYKHREESRKVGAAITTHFTSVHTVHSRFQDLISSYKDTPPDTAPNCGPNLKTTSGSWLRFKMSVGDVGTLKGARKKAELTTNST